MSDLRQSPPFVLAEKNPGGFVMPVGSVLVVDDARVYYRDIDSRHIFKPTKDYQAIGIDDEVVQYLSTPGMVEQVWFYRTDTGELLRTKFENFQCVSPRKVKGREQRFVRINSFQVEKNGQQQPRPRTRVVIGEDLE